MSLQLDDFDASGDVFGYLDWAIETGIWDGRQVSYTEASEFCDEIQERIIRLFFENPESPLFEQLSAQLAWIGAPAASRSLLRREIEALDISRDNLVLQAGLKKSLSTFWKKHKKEILIGAAVIAVVTVVVVVAVSTVGSGTGAAVAAGGAALQACADKKEKEKPAPLNRNDPPPSQLIVPEPPPLSLDSPIPNNLLTFQEKGVWLNGQYASYDNILLNQCEQCFSDSFAFSTPKIGESLINEKSLLSANSESITAEAPWDGIAKGMAACETIEALALPEQTGNAPKSSWLTRAIEMLGKTAVDCCGPIDPNAPLPTREISCHLETLGEKLPHLNIGGINGINTSKEEAISHAQHLGRLVQDYRIDWVYNRSHGVAIDLLEVFILNYLGFSPNTARLLRENWDEFHKKNADRPKAKYLQFCHSQGAIHVRNALIRAPKEIRDRVIVVAIAPAMIVPNECCFQSFNYASKKDIVHYGELLFGSISATDDCRTSKQMEILLEFRNELILLDPHPDAVGIDHDFEGPTFIRPITERLEDYIINNGEFE